MCCLLQDYCHLTILKMKSKPSTGRSTVNQRKACNKALTKCGKKCSDTVVNSNTCRQKKATQYSSSKTSSTESSSAYTKATKTPGIIYITDPVFREWCQSAVSRAIDCGRTARAICLFVYLKRFLVSVDEATASRLKRTIYINDTYVKMFPGCLQHPDDCICELEPSCHDELALMYFQTSHPAVS